MLRSTMCTTDFKNLLTNNIYKMRKNIYLVTFLFLSFITSGIAQRTAVMSKVTATWCPRCGTYGWSAMEDLKADYASEESDALVLGVHFSGNLENDLSKWFASNLEAFGQPQFYVANELYPITNASWMTQVDDIKTAISEYANDDTSFSSASIRTYDNVSDNGDFNISVDVSHNGDTSEELFLSVYVFENNVEDIQASRQGVVMHPNVLRESITDEFFGDLIASPGDASQDMNLNYTWTPNADYNIDNVGVLAIVWRKVGDNYIIDSSTAKREWTAQLSSTEQFAVNDFTVINKNNTIEVSSNASGTYHAQLVNAQGQVIVQKNFSDRTTLSSNTLSSGLYILSVTEDTKQISYKLYID